MRNLIICALVLFGAVTVNAQKVKVGSDPAVDFTKYKTYSWDQGMMGNPFVKEQIVAAVDREMSAKGMRRVESDPDLVITTMTGTASELVNTSPSWAPALNSINSGIPVINQPWPITNGSLVITLSDAKTKNGVWRASATQTLENGPTGDPIRDAKSVVKPINKAVQKMFKQFPPKK